MCYLQRTDFVHDVPVGGAEDLGVDVMLPFVVDIADERGGIASPYL